VRGSTWKPQSLPPATHHLSITYTTPPSLRRDANDDRSGTRPVNPTLTAEEMAYIAKHNSQHCFYKDQTHGMIIIVPPGYIHAVTNIRPNFKFALDRVQRDQAPYVTIVRETIAVPYFGKRMPDDYVRITNKAASFLESNLPLPSLF
jgi:hypothetical protein